MRDSNAVRAGSMHRALVDLLSWLQARDYRFVTVTPSTHARVLARRSGERACDLRDVFGWSLPFDEGLLPQDLLDPLRAAGLIEDTPGGLKCRLRAASLDGRIFLHSAYPTDRAEAVFFGPDTYRFCALIADELDREPAQGALLDIGTGSGAGAVFAARRMTATRVVLTDVNPWALGLARANAQVAGIAVETVLSPHLTPVQGKFPLILANPPFIDDADRLPYRHGGTLGLETAIAWTDQALAKLSPDGRFLLYCGSPIVAGEDRLRARLGELCRSRHARLDYQEADPDIFGEQLDEPAYARVERIAAIRARISWADRTGPHNF